MVPKLNLEVRKSCNIKTSIYTAECIALLQATEIALVHRDRDVFIFSDSLSALQSLEGAQTDIHTNQYILQIKLKYQSFMKNNPHNKLLFYWIPAHLGIEGNECADQAAKRATEKSVRSIH